MPISKITIQFTNLIITSFKLKSFHTSQYFKMNQKNEQRNLIIYFYIPNKCLKKIKVIKYVYIKLLLTFINENTNEYIFIYDGTVVNSKSTFDDIGIKNGEVLIALKNNNNMDDINSNINLSSKMKKLTKDPNFETKLKLIMNKNIRYETERIKDMQFKKIEGNSNLYRKKIKNYYSTKGKQNKDQKDLNLNTNYQPLPKPSEEEMPIIWSC